MNKLACLIVVLLLSGCFSSENKETGEKPSDPPDGNHPGTDPDGDGNETNGREPVIGNETVPMKMQLDGCAYWEFFVSNFPSALLPGDVPEGWEQQQPLGSVYASGWRCDKISLGPYERGPIWFVTDAHSNMEPPSACDNPNPYLTNSYLLHTFIVDDPELQEYLNETYGMPVMLATITGAEEPLGTVSQHDWTWTPQGGMASTLTILDDKNQSPDITHFTRFYWERGDGIARLEFEMARDRSGERPTQGHFEAPMLFAEFMDGDVTGQGGWYPNSEATGRFKFYKDTLCEEPE